MLGRQKVKQPVSKGAPAEIKPTDESKKGVLPQPASTPFKPVISEKSSLAHGFKKVVLGYWHHKIWTLPLTLLLIVVVLYLIPTTRYSILGLFLKEDAVVTVSDSMTHTPVSGAKISFGSSTVTTLANGKATISIPVGSHALEVSKQYYRSSSPIVFVSLSKASDTFQEYIVATGRQVPIKVVNKVTNQPIANADIKILDTEAKTDKNGTATIVLPVTHITQSGTVSDGNFNTSPITVQVTNQIVAANTFGLTPTGTVFFLSNLSGTIDVVKTNLDGTDRQTVLAGTGNESPTDTVLLASRDWKYLALLAQRSSSGGPELNIINTSTGQETNIDGGDVTFRLVGWDGDRFIYEVNQNNVLQWQNGQELLKSYNAPTKSSTTLVQTIATGTSNYSYLGENIGSVYILDGKVVYSMNWAADDEYVLEQNNKPATLNNVNPDGSDNTVIKSFVSQVGSQFPQFSINTVSYDEPNSIAIQFSTDSGNNYYEFGNGAVTPSTDLNDQNFYNSYPTFLLSPSGNHTFWSEPADGKYNLFVGDANGQHPVSVGRLSDYSPYGWFTDSYLLVSKNSSELYIMPVKGGTPIPISDYFKPSQFYNNGYGGGYGGL